MKNQKIKICFTGILFFVMQFTCIQLTHSGASSGIECYSQEKVFQAGAATSNITPFLGGGIIGGWTRPPAKHINDELHARCLVLDDGDTRLAFIVADLMALNFNVIQEAKRLINQETNIPVENIMVSATHTHSATSVLGEKRRDWSSERSFDEYQEFVIRRIADGVRIAVNNLEPARIGWGVGNVPEHVFVRRWIMKTPQPNPFGGQDKARMNPGVGNPDLIKPTAEPDPEVSFISVQSKDGRSIALLANYSLHYVGTRAEGNISASYFGVFADRIQELLGADRQDPPFVGIMSNGTSGDVTSTNQAGGPARRYGPFEKMNHVADDVAREVMRVYKTVKHHDWVSLRAAQEELTLQIRKPDRQLIERSRWVLSRPDTVTPVHPRESVYAQRVLQLLEWPDEIDVVLQAFRIGELGVTALPFETFAETGLEIKDRSPFKPSFTIELANGYFRYLPTPRQHDLGGYETWLGTNIVEIEASDKVTSKIIELFDRMRNEP